jgi:hypothetical protein
MSWQILNSLYSVELAEKTCSCNCSCTCNCDGITRISAVIRSTAGQAGAGGTAAGNSIGSPQNVQFLQ